MPLEESLRDEFAVETEEHLDAIEAGLNPPSEARPAIDALFRAFHSLKGMSDAVGAAGMKALAHRAEDALGLARQGKLSVARAAPALQIFSIGLSILVAAGVMVLVASMGDIAMGLSEHIGSLSSRLEQLLVLIAPQPP